MIDAIGPFFVGYDKRVINWSKIPFQNLERDNRLDPVKVEMVINAYATFIDRIAALGFNAVTIDDLAHLVLFDFYPDDFKVKLNQYRAFYRRIFGLTVQKGLKIFVNTDIMFSHPSMQPAIGRSVAKNTKLLKGALETLFSDFSVDGVIFRIGECDGTDVMGDFQSRLTIKHPKTANRFIRDLLPVFEDYDRKLIFRTWTVGSYRIGDLIWNAETYEQTFAGISSPHFIVSMKYGDTDFFSALELNPLFYRLNHQTVLELQTRRERECFGVLPYFVGWDYETYYRQLKAAKNCIGISVWCQTGGWSRNNALTFLENGSFWNELNTVAAIRIFKDGWSADRALESGLPDKEQRRFLREFHRLLFRILYPPGFAKQKLYFRRTRIPPLMWLSWDYITVNPLIKSLYFSFSQSQQMLDVDDQDIETVRHMGVSLKIDQIDFFCDTLLVFLYCIRTVLGCFPNKDLIEKTTRYREAYPECNLKFRIMPDNVSRQWMDGLIPLLIRQDSGYRLIDRITLNRGLSWIQRKLVLRISRDQLPKYADKRAMRPEVLFK